MRIAYLIAGLIVAALVVFNAPRLPWIHTEPGDPVGLLRGFMHGMIGVSYMASWALVVAGGYQLILGVIYWDMDTTEAQRWQFTMESGGTARLLWVTGALTLLAGLGWGYYTYSHDNYLWPCGALSTLFALLSCWLMWLAFPLMEQVGIDRDQIGV